MDMGRTTPRERKGATRKELKYAAWGTIIGMFFPCKPSYKKHYLIRELIVSL
jgi:hypothetical protein